MPGIVMDGNNGEVILNESDGIAVKENLELNKSPKSPLSSHSPRNTGLNLPVDGVAVNEVAVDEVVDTSIEKLYENVCDMQSSDQSPSRQSFGSDGEESRIDSELRYLLGGEMREIEIMEEEEVDKPEDDNHNAASSKRNSSSGGMKSGKLDIIQSASSKSVSLSTLKKSSRRNIELEASSKPSPKGPPEIPPIDKRIDKHLKKAYAGVSMVKKHGNSPLARSQVQNRGEDLADSDFGNLELGRYLLKQARDLISSGDNPRKALELALQAAKSFEVCANGKPSLELVMCLHVTAAIHCSLGQYKEAIPVLERLIEVPVVEEGQDHALAKFAGNMQLGDTYAMLGQLENSTKCYAAALEIQKQVLGDNDHSVGETCRYLAEAHVQALQFDEAERLCQMALDIHRGNNTPASLEEAADRRLMGLICETKGNHEAALEHLVLASMAMVANGQEAEVAYVDCSIGDTFLSLTRYDEAVFSYQKALTAFKTSAGENHPTVGSVFVRLADLYNKTGKLKESKSYCENALRIYKKPAPGIPPEEIANGLTNIAAIYETMNELEQAIKLLKKALKIYNNASGQQNTIAGIEAQMGVMYYMLGNYSESYNFLKKAISKLRASGEKKSSFFGIALNQMGLACVQRYSINEAVELFEEAKSVLEHQLGPYHPDTLGVYSNLAGSYDAMGRRDDAIEILEYVVGMREEKLGTANPDVDDEKRRLAELLKEAGRVRSRKSRSLENLLDTNSHKLSNEITTVS